MLTAIGTPKKAVAGDHMDKVSTAEAPALQSNPPPLTCCVSCLVNSLIFFPFLLIGANIVEDFEV